MMQMQPTATSRAATLCASWLGLTLFATLVPLVGLNAEEQPTLGRAAAVGPTEPLGGGPIETRFFGTIQAGYSSASAATSYAGTETLHGPSSAKRQIEHDDSHKRSHFSANNTSFGVDIRAGERAHAVVEISFDGNETSQTANIREGLVTLRRAALSYDIGNYWTIFGGLDESLFAPLSPLTYNGNDLLAGGGNVGYYQTQIGIESRTHRAGGLKLALGTISPDGKVGPNETTIHNRQPALSMLFYHRTSDQLELQLSGIIAKINYRHVEIENRLRSYATECRSGIGAITPADYPWNLEDPWINPCLSTSPALFDREVADPLGTPGSIYAFPWAMHPHKVERGAGAAAIGVTWNSPQQRYSLEAELYSGVNLRDLDQQGIGYLTSRSGRERFSDGYFGHLRPLSDNDRYTRTASLFFAPEFDSIQEDGGWLSFTWRPTTALELTILGGGSKIRNYERLAPAQGDLTMNNGGGREDGGGFERMGDIKASYVRGGSIGYKISDAMTLFFEFQQFESHYHEADRLTGLLPYSANGVIVPEMAQGPDDDLLSTIMLNVRSPLYRALAAEYGLGFQLLPLTGKHQATLYNLYDGPFGIERAAPRVKVDYWSAGMRFDF